MDPQDPSSWRLPGAAERSPDAARADSRDRGIRRVRRLSNLTAVALIAATAVTAGYFARASSGAAKSAAVTNAQSQAPNARQPCVTVPVATSGGSGVTTTTTRPAQSCAANANGTRPAVVYADRGEGGGD